MIFLDLRLTNVDGLDGLQAMKQDDAWLRIPVVVLSSSDEDRDIAKAYDWHANSRVAKPLDFNKFSELIRDLGYYWLGWNVHLLVQN